jgi:hypothetical protein
VFEEPADEPCTDVVAALVEERRQLMQRMLGARQNRCAEQSFLVAEEVIDHRDVHAGVRGDSPDGRPLVPVAREPVACRVDDALLALLTGAPPAAASFFGHAPDDTSTRVGLTCHAVLSLFLNAC